MTGEVHAFNINVHTVDTTATVQFSSIIRAVRERSERVRKALDFDFTNFDHTCLLNRMAQLEPERNASEQLAVDVVEHELPFTSLTATVKDASVNEFSALTTSRHTLHRVVAYDHYLKVKHLSEAHVRTIKAEFVNLRRFATALLQVEGTFPGKPAHVHLPTPIQEACRTPH